MKLKNNEEASLKLDDCSNFQLSSKILLKKFFGFWIFWIKVLIKNFRGNFWTFAADYLEKLRLKNSLKLHHYRLISALAVAKFF